MHRENGKIKATPIGSEIRPSSKNGSGFESKRVTYALRFFAYALPISFLLYVLYWNFLPFGYEETFVIDVGAPGDTSGEFYLEPSRDLSERRVAQDGTTYRELNGIAYAVFKPKAVLKNAEITVTVDDGDSQSESPSNYVRTNNTGSTGGVSIIPPVIDFDPDSVDWDYEWDFANKDTAFDTKMSERAKAEWTAANAAASDSSDVAQRSGETPDVAPDSSVAPLKLEGNAFHFDNCAYFDGKSRLELPDSADIFEKGPFTVYVEWAPQSVENDRQQIVGHFNWELFQDKDTVRFQIGRMDSATGTFHSVTYPVISDFFDKKHSALAVYSPSNKGYMELFVDGNLAGRTFFGTSTIWKSYGDDKNLAFGKSEHGKAMHYTGCLTQINFVYAKILKSKTHSFIFSGNEIIIPIESGTNTPFVSIIINVK